MESTPQSNLARLEGAGLVLKELPQELLDVIDGLTPLEVDVLVAVGKRLDAADRCRQGEHGYTYFMTF